MKIAMITSGYLPVPAVRGGAVEVLTQDLIEGNEEYQNNNIDLYTVDDERLDNYNYKYTTIIKVNISLPIKIINGVVNQFYKLFRIKKYRTSYSRATVKLLKHKKYDLVVVQNNLMAYRDIYEKTSNKQNLVYFLHNDINVADENHVIIAQMIAKTAKKILAVSKHTKNEFLKIDTCQNADIDVLYNCINIEKYKVEVDKKEIDNLRAQYGIKSSDTVFMYSGRVDVYKGVLELVKAFTKIDKQNVKLLIVGKSWFGEEDVNNEYIHQLNEAAKKQRDHIIFTGFVSPEEIQRFYQMVDCLVVPSLWEEPFGVVALEGMASKLPLIVTRSGGMMEFVDESCAFIVDKEKNVVENIEVAIHKLLNIGEKKNIMGQNGYMKVISKRDFDKKNYYQIFCEKLGI